MQQLGWGAAPPATNGGWAACGMEGVEAPVPAQVDPQELSELAARALRVLLGADHWLPLSCLRLAVLGSTHDSRRCEGTPPPSRRSPGVQTPCRPQRHRRPPPPLRPPAVTPLPPSPAPRSKCLLELAVASLCEQGLVVRQGYGPLAALSVSPAGGGRVDEERCFIAAGVGAAAGSCARLRPPQPRDI